MARLKLPAAPAGDPGDVSPKVDNLQWHACFSTKKETACRAAAPFRWCAWTETSNWGWVDNLSAQRRERAAPPHRRMRMRVSAVSPRDCACAT
eukprot:scaffold48573_cov64-Phaeocystis_antarctica.AAC.5